jgi:hypothetical protein
MIILLILSVLVNFLVVDSSELFYNGTHRTNLTKVEVTTVRIAEIVNLHNNSTNSTLVLKEMTAKHFVTPTMKTTKAILIPPAMINAQIRKHKQENAQHFLP